jgi:hypothetical protein
MKKFIFTSLLLFIIVAIQVQGFGRGTQNQQVTATLKASSRLFAAKEDLTSVIIIIPSGSVVNIIGSDSTYYKVTFEENEGYIFKRHAEINTAPPKTTPTAQPKNFSEMDQNPVQKLATRYSYLENKYGTNMATRLMAGKVWKGMSSEMVKDSWGTPVKINRVVGDVVKEEWIYNSSWLYLEENILVQWGPIKK